MDQAKIGALAAAEKDRFQDERPRSMEATARATRTMPRGVPMSWMDELYDHPPLWVSHGAGSRFWDLDGHEYVDMYVADMSAFCGHAPEPVVRAVSQRIAAGNQFLLPSEDALIVAETLADRYGMAKWQFTLSATQANTEVVRVARVRTGRKKVVVFDGKYHGHLDPTLGILEDGRVRPEYTGLPIEVTDNLRIVPFNDLDAVERALAPGDVALLLTEPAMTNAGFILPGPGFHDGLREITRRHGTLLGIDETHTLVTAHGGLTTEWGLEPDMLTIGKSIAGGVPLAAYGMTDEVADVLRPPTGGAAVSGIAYDEVATGGTLFANAPSMAAARAALTEVLTRAAFIATARLGRNSRQAYAHTSTGPDSRGRSTATVHTPSTSSAHNRHTTPAALATRTTPRCGPSSGCSSPTGGYGSQAGGSGRRCRSRTQKRTWTRTWTRSGSSPKRWREIATGLGVNPAVP